ncbi:hypothetical protein [Sporomusa sp.]|uniref:hypothetical protein n=1 Tax=Sporomusa sp. TaxID=2078658 RepID=UPI002B776346|nr:hypothetical protein [Sporomusa sp.]HWR42337.1 hypothetical protein [Sporomusa sp.]
MSESKDVKQHQADRLQIVFGNTDRTAEEIIAHIRRHTNEFAGLTIQAAKAIPQRVGQVVVDVQAPAADIDTAKLRRVLNEAGSCMFQVDSIEKI